MRTRYILKFWIFFKKNANDAIEIERQRYSLIENELQDAKTRHEQLNSYFEAKISDLSLALCDAEKQKQRDLMHINKLTVNC